MVTIQGEISVDSDIPGVDAEKLGPFTIQIDRDGSLFRRKIALPAGQWITPDLEGLTPWLFCIFPIGATYQVQVGFGQGEPIVLDAGGPPAIFTGSQVPSMRAVGGASEVIFFVMTAS